ncbi:MAG: type II toxin-antitoxin system RelE/ParE family toxin [Gammaproteobacteria bacterium]
MKTFRHKGLEAFFQTGSKAGIQPAHGRRLRLQLATLDASVGAQGMNLPGWRLHPLSGVLSGHWAVAVSGNWRLTFKFDGKDAVLVDYQDYH